MTEQFGDFWKREMMEKPGTAIHSPKWDSCVEHVKQSKGGKNAYAICTEMLGDESMKAIGDEDFLAKVDEYIETLGISSGVKNASRQTKKDVSAGYAGDVPNSLLADQDLEGTTKASPRSQSHEQRVDLNEVTKDQVDEAKKDLIEAAEDTDASKKTIAERIIEAQKKTMGATISARQRAGDAVGKSFSEVWKNLGA